MVASLDLKGGVALIELDALGGGETMVTWRAKAFTRRSFARPELRPERPPGVVRARPTAEDGGRKA
jgi:hypothetical protein